MTFGGSLSKIEVVCVAILKISKNRQDLRINLLRVNPQASLSSLVHSFTRNHRPSNRQPISLQYTHSIDLQNVLSMIKTVMKEIVIVLFCCRCRVESAGNCEVAAFPEVAALSRSPLPASLRVHCSPLHRDPPNLAVCAGVAVAPVLGNYFSLTILN